MERFVVLGFSFGCTSESSVGVGTRSQPKRPNAERSRKETSALVLFFYVFFAIQVLILTGLWFWNVIQGRQEGEGSSYKEKKKSFRSLLSIGIKKLIRSIKNFSQLFVYREEMEGEMEIGFPTDVKHVTHIGLDGSTMTNHVKGWENVKTPEIISFPSISLKQFEVAMDAQVHAQPSTL